MDAKKALIIAALALGITLAVSFLISPKENKTQSKKTILPVTVPQGTVEREIKTALPPSPQPLEIVNQSPSLSDISINDHTKISDVLEKGLDILKEQKMASVNPTSETLQEASSVELLQKPLLSDSQIFEKIWPLSYRADLKKIEDIMITDKFLKEGERNSMATDQNMFDFYRTLLHYAYTKEYIDEKKYTQFLHGLNDVLPDIVAKEETGLRMHGDFQASLPKDQHLEVNTGYAQLFHDLLDGLAYVFSFAEPANAAWINTGADCYKDDVPLFPVPGPNLLAFCCNCGLQCTPFCHPVPDCGPEGTLCQIPFGCLNLACRAWPNAIWDPTTGICGCG